MSESELNGAVARPFDLASLRELEKRQEEGVEVVIKDALGAVTNFVVRMAGPDSRKVRVARQRLADVRIRQQKTSVTAAEVEQETGEIVGSAIIGWTGLVDGDQPVEFSPEKAKAIAQSPLIRDQLMAAVQDRLLFMTG